MTPTERFSNRVENYARHRPSYPPAVMETLRAECGLAPDSVVADVGSGTGILTEQLLRVAGKVYGVEPNREMREEAERQLSARAKFISVAATAESTTLPGASIDLITAAQCLHWFNLSAARAEFSRILKPGGWMAVIWNDRRDASPFMQAYRQILLRHSTDYRQVDHKRITPDVLRKFFGAEFETRVFDNPQVFDWEGMRGRMLSSSYMPVDNQQAIEELREIFDRHQRAGRVTFEQETALYWGRLTPAAA